ncbi:MAG TPA: TonB-dependent receptor, partial [bacterium]|nr:TonB-dependent receptor [bacterium]
GAPPVHPHKHRKKTGLLTPTPEVTPLAPAQEATPSPVPTPELSSSAPTQETVSSPSALKKLSLEQLMDLDVTSVNKQPEPYGHAAAAIDVITNDEIRRSGASNIPEALRLADNLDVAQVGSSNWDISARGFNSSVGDKLLVLIDGRSVYTPLFSGVIWGMQDYLLEDIDRIEVISGPGGTMWGANAVNGVINITSKSAKDTQGLYVETGGGSQLEEFTAARYGGSLAPDVYYRVYGKYFDEGTDVFPDGTSAQDSWNRGQAGFRVDDTASPQDQYTLQGDFFYGDTNVVPGGEGNPQEQGASSDGHLLGRLTHTFEKDSDMTLQVYFDQSYMVAPFQGAPAEPAFSIYFPPSPAIPGGNLTDDLYTYDADFQDRFPLGSWNHVIWGLGYRFTHDVVQDAPSVAFVPGTLDQHLYSGFLQDEVRLLPDFSLTLGSKLEHNDYTGFEYEPSGRLQWDITDKQMLWAAVSRAVRMPSRYDRDLYQPGPENPYIFAVTGNSTFESEDVVAYELGYRAQIGPNVSGSLSAFYNFYSRLRSESQNIVLGDPEYLIDVYFQNNLDANTYGLEFSADYQVLDGWRLHSGYDLLKEQIIIEPGGDLDDGLAQTSDPQNQVFLRSSMDLPYRTELDVDFRWIDSVQTNNAAAAAILPSYAEMDVRLGWQVTPNTQLSIVGQNLLQDQHAEAGYPGPAQEQIPRTFYGKAAFGF